MTKEQATREALEKALAAMEKLVDAAEGFNVSGVYFNEELWARKCLDDAYDAMGLGKEALAVDNQQLTTEAQPAIAEQHKQEPVVWMYQNKSTHEVRFQKHMRSFVDHGAWYEVPLYSEPLANQEKTSGSPIKQVLAQPEQERNFCQRCGKRLGKNDWDVHTCTPPQPEQEPTPTPNEGFEGSIRIFLKKSDGQWERLEKLEQVHEYNKQQWAQPEQELTSLERHERNVQQLFGTPQPKEPEQEKLMRDQIGYGTTVTQGGKRIDPMSIYKEPEQEPVAMEMTAHRAAYFMERFKHEEKLLGPNEQAALDFVISMLEAQPEQEPVAFPRNVQEYDEDWIIDPAFLTRVKHSIDPETPYEFTPSEEQIETTLLALEVIPASLYTTPPQRKPLTDEQIADIYCKASGINFYLNFARAIEAAHGIKE